MLHFFSVLRKPQSQCHEINGIPKASQSHGSDLEKVYKIQSKTASKNEKLRFVYSLIIECAKFEFLFCRMMPAACDDHNACGTEQQMMFGNFTTTTINCVLRKITAYMHLPFKNQI